MTEGYKEYLALMRQWYSERLLDQEFVTRTESNFPVTSLLSADKLGGYIGIYNQAACSTMIPRRPGSIFLFAYSLHDR